MIPFLTGLSLFNHLQDWKGDR